MGQKAVVTERRSPSRHFVFVKECPLVVPVTLRQERMWEFLDRMMNIALPRVRDFRGVNPKGFDGRG